ncbi:MAG: dihydrolipoyl dehydrogenase [Acidimicrobiia bacterium]
MADVPMPQLGETVTEGTITRWFKQVGDSIAEDEPLFEVSTDKVDSEVPSPVSGTITEILVGEGDTVEVGTVLARIGDEGAAPASDAGGSGAQQEPQSQPDMASEVDESAPTEAGAPVQPEQPTQPTHIPSTVKGHGGGEVDRQEQHFDVVVIGGGPGGYATALYGASAGLSVALIEKNKLGGTCLNVGCIPAKELLESAHVHRTIKGAAEFGFEVGEVGINWTRTIERKQEVVDRLVGGLGQLLKGRKVTVFDGHGRLHAGHKVTIGGGESGDVAISGDSVVIAAGSLPRTIPGFDVDGKVVMTSDEFLSMDPLPSTAVVIGGGAIGCEFASTMSDMGTEVTILEALDQIIPGCDADVVRAVQQSFKKRGIDVKTGVKVSGHQPKDGGGTTVTYGDGETIDVDVVVVSVGRRPNTDDLGLDGTQVSVSDRGFVDVDDRCRTGEPGVWAVGDCIATPALAHVAFAEGIVVVKDILEEEPVPVDHRNVPWAIYCHPEVAFAGLTEQAAKEAGYDVVTSKHRWTGNGRAMIIGDTEGVVKVIAEKDADGKAGRILGVHLCGPWATEQLGQGYLAVNWEATVDEVAHFIQPHPTLSELFGETVLSMTGRSLHG